MVIAIAGRTGGAGLAECPIGGEALAHAASGKQGVSLGRRPHAGEIGLAKAEENEPRFDCVDDGAAEEVIRRAGHRQKRARDQSAGR
jgi:hypothetical protein